MFNAPPWKQTATMKENKNQILPTEGGKKKSGLFLTEVFGVSDIKSCSLKDFYSNYSSTLLKKPQHVAEDLDL